MHFLCYILGYCIFYVRGLFIFNPFVNLSALLLLFYNAEINIDTPNYFSIVK